MSAINRTLAQLIARFPDNTNRQIHPQQSRDLSQSAIGAIYAFDPGAGDDNVNTNGNGFFDTFNKWLNSATGTFWICFIGTPGAAIWLSFPQGGLSGCGFVSAANYEAGKVQLLGHTAAGTCDFKPLDSLPTRIPGTIQLVGIDGAGELFLAETEVCP